MSKDSTGASMPSKITDFFRARAPIAFMALRNLSRHLTATILLGGVIGFGIMVVSLLQGTAGALAGNIGKNVANIAAGHVFVEGLEKTESGREISIIRDDKVLMESFAASGMKPQYVTKRAFFLGNLIFEANQSQQEVDGVDFANEKFLLDRLSIKEGKVKDMMNEPQGIIVSTKMAEKLKVKPGYRIRAQLKTLTGQQNAADFTVVAVMHDMSATGSASAAFANLSYVNQLLDMPAGSYQQLGFYLDNFDKTDKAGKAFYAELKKRAPQVFDRVDPNARKNIQSLLREQKASTWTGVKYRMTTINEYLSTIKDIVNGINIAALIFLFVIYLVIVIGIMNTFRMIMYDRIREIGTIRALGMERGQVRNLFLLEALFMALGGMLTGLVLSWLIMGGLSLIQLGPDNPLYFFLKAGHPSFSVDPWYTIANIGIVAGLTLLAAFFPARSAARLEPAHALRTTK